MKKFLWEIIGFILLVFVVGASLFLDPYKRSQSYRNRKFKQDWHRMINAMEIERKNAYDKLEKLENHSGKIAIEDKAMLAYCRTSEWSASDELADSVTFQSPIVGTVLPHLILDRHSLDF